MTFPDWNSLFSYLSERVFNKECKKKKVLFFDELQWMAAGRSRLISLLKYFWDNHWKDQNIMLVLCGSIASFMVKKVLRSKALYGRTTLEIHLKGLGPADAYKLIGNKRSHEECLKYLLVFGSVPKYLEQINLNLSFDQNMNRLCFSPNGVMFQEIERIFYNQFREAQAYLRIVSLLKDGIFSLKEVAVKLKLPSGGGLKSYLENLERAEIIRSITPFGKGLKTKIRKYTLSDEFLVFYFKYIDHNKKTIHESTSSKLFQVLTKESFQSWLGFAF